MVARFCAVSVDLDEIDQYRGLHGLPPSDLCRHGVYDLALDRIGDFAAQLDIPLTLFAVGKDLERPQSATQLAALHDRGHRIENHSYTHRYDLSRLDRGQMEEEVARGQAVIEQLTGRRPVGFRAPGYTLSDRLLEVLAAQGLSFDSSAFPCPSYYLAKCAALGWLKLRGRGSRAIVGSPLALAAPRTPYPQAGRGGHHGGAGLLELPISVTRRLRLPFIGTSITLAGSRGARLLARGCVDSPLVNLELHGIDFLDVSDGLDDLIAYQPDVRLPRDQKLVALVAAIDELRRYGGRFVTLSQAARELERERP
ncbi:MAG: polysaccharide deacetylase [Deltaproteobacteria bacterium]|nr:MAG: polysaccharide deacetylase [Deltaproteobacteria bacterium]